MRPRQAGRRVLGRLFNVDVTWFDGELSAEKQRAAIEQMAAKKWDFVAIQANDIDTLTEPVVRMIDAGIPVIDMDTLIAPLDQIDVLTFLEPDNEFMGAAVTQALVEAIGGQGTIIMTQGALGHTGAQGRARGFESVIANFPDVDVLATEPADWDVSKTTQLWETYLDVPEDRRCVLPQRRYGARRRQRYGSTRRTEILIGGVDAMPPAIEAVVEGRMHATVRNSSCRIHGGAIVAGAAAARASRQASLDIPKHIIVDGPIVTKANAPGMLWMEEQFLI